MCICQPNKKSVMTDFYEDEISSQIVAELDHRVKRLEFYLTGALELEDVPRDEASIKPDLHSRLKGIEDTVSKAAAQRRVLQDMVNLCLFFCSPVCWRFDG